MLTYADIIKAVATSMTTTTGVKRVQAYDEITESIPEWPLLQVYAESGEVDTGNDETDRSSFGAGVRQTEMVIRVDVYSRRRSNIGEDLKAQMDLIDAIDAKFVQQVKPFFGLENIQAFRWKWERATLLSGKGDGATEFAGCRFTLTLVIY